MTAAPLLVFDGDCAFCTSSVRWLEARLAGSFRAVPYQWADLAVLGLTAQECHARVQWVPDERDPSAGRRSGGAAVGALLVHGGTRRGGAVGSLTRAAGLLATAWPTAWAGEAVYRLVAANRSRLPGGTPACGR